MGWLVRLAVAGLQVLALTFAAAAVVVEYGKQRPGPVVLQAQRAPAPSPAKDVTEYRLDQLEAAARQIENEQRLLAYLLVGNLVAVIVSLVTYLILERRRSGPR